MTGPVGELGPVDAPREQTGRGRAETGVHRFFVLVSVALVAAYWSALATLYVNDVVISLVSLGDFVRWAAVVAVMETALFSVLLRGSGERLAGLGLSFAALYWIALGTHPGPNPLAEALAGENLPLLAVLSLLAGFREEIERAFCITRFERGFGTAGLVTAILVDAVLFGRGHWNQGTLGMITTGIMGVGYSLVFLRRRRVADAMVAHAFMDVLVVVSLSTQR